MKAVGLGFLGCLAGSAVCWRGARSTWSRGGDAGAPAWISSSFPARRAGAADLCEGCVTLAEGGMEGNYKTAYITSATHPYKCLHILGKPGNGSSVQVWDCPVDEDLVTKFLVPVGVVGPIRPVSAPHLCLDSPEGYKLQLWSCEDVQHRRSVERVRFLVRPEAAAWLRYNHYDLPNEEDVEQMSANDLDAVMEHVHENGYVGFAVWHGQAWIKGVQGLSKDDLHYMGLKDPVVFYLYRPEGDFTIRSAHDPGLCVGTPGKIPENGDTLHLFKCATEGMYKRLEETRFRLHYATLDELEEERMHRMWRHTAQRAKRREEAPRPTEGPTSPPEVVVSMTLTGIDYALLTKNKQLTAMVTDVIKEEIAGAAGGGISPDSVTPVLKQGSVKVESTIKVPEGTPVDSVTSRVKESRTLKSAIAGRVNDLPGMDKVTTGVVAAEHGATKASSPGGVHLPNLWPWIGAFLAAVLTGMCLVAAFLERTRLRSAWVQNWAKMQEQMRSRSQKSTALTAYKTREPVINIEAPGVWRLGRIGDRTRPGQASYDVDLDSNGGRAATLSLGYSPVSDELPAAALSG